jgi:hypothetical protein
VAEKEKSKDVFDGFTTLEGGVNSGVVPSLVKENQLSFAANATLRGGYATARAMFHQRVLDFGGNTVLESRFRTGRWQGGESYQSDAGQTYLIWCIGGRQFVIKPGPVKFKVQEITINIQTVTTLAFVVPAVGSTVSVSVLDTSNLHNGYQVEIAGHNYVVTSVTSPTTVTVKNVDDVPGSVIGVGAQFIFWDVNPASRSHAWLWQSEKWMIINDGQSVPIFFDGATSRRSNVAGDELTAGRMGVYWKGRNWWVNPDGLTFRAGDLVYSSSGTPAEQKRDAVLKQTQNIFLTSGNFSVPANAGQIMAMKAVANLDVSLGQGPLQVLTATTIFNCDAPVDLTEWQNTNSVLLSVSQIEGGGLSQYSTVVANGDLFYRSFAGIQTLILGRRDFQQRWGNKPVSREMNRIMLADNPSLLEFSTAIVFNNRLLMSASPTVSDRGIYHRAVVALDFDILSTLQGSPPPIYDGGWTGLQVLQMMKGVFGSMERAFAASFNGSGEIDLFEIMPSGVEFADTNNDLEYPVVWSLETGDMFKRTGLGAFERVRLQDGEIYVDDIRGRVDIRIFYRPDAYPCWVFWHGWSICAKQEECLPDPFTCLSILNAQPQYRVRMGFGEPSPKPCDPITNKPFREFYTCQIRILVQGWMRISGLKLRAVETMEPLMAPMMCQSPTCDLLPELPPEPDVNVRDAWLTHENNWWSVDDDTYFLIS